MIKHCITKGSEIQGLEGTFKCESYNGSIVCGTFEELGGAVWHRRLTLSEIAGLMHSMDGKNHKAFWEEPEGEE